MQVEIKPCGTPLDTDSDDGLSNLSIRSAKSRKFEYVWRNIIVMALLHILALYGGWFVISGQMMLKTFIFGDYSY